MGACKSEVFKIVSPTDYLTLTLHNENYDAWLMDWALLVYSDDTQWKCENKHKIWLSMEPFDCKTIFGYISYTMKKVRFS